MFDKDTNPDEDLNPAAAIETLKAILIDRAIGDRIKVAVGRAGKCGIYGLPQILEESRAKREEIMAIGKAPSISKLWPRSPTDLKASRKPSVWLIDDVLVAGQPGVLGGPRKTLKTAISMDLAVSLGIGPGVKFLGRFEIPKQCKVGFWSAESGMDALIRRYEAVLASKDRKPEDCDLVLNEKVPHFDNAAELAEFEACIKELKLEVVIIDPLDVALGAFAADLPNTALTSQRLQRFNEICERNGATLIVDVHATKASDKKANGSRNYDELRLEDLAYGGVGAWARQWVLLRRQADYAYNGEHSLKLAVGGSSGQCGLYDLKISEGVLQKDRTGWCWRVSTCPCDAPTTEGREKRETEKLDAILTDVHNALHREGGKAGISVRKLSAHVSGGRDALAKRLVQLRDQGRAEVCGVGPGNGDLWRAKCWDGPFDACKSG